MLVLDGMSSSMKVEKKVCPTGLQNKQFAIQEFDSVDPENLKKD